RPRAHGVVSGWTNGAEAPARAVAECEVDPVEHRAGGCGRRIPRSLAHDGIGVESTAAASDESSDRFDVRAVVRDRQLVDRRVARVDVLDATKELRIFAQRLGNRAKPAGMLGVTPTGVVATAVGARDERDRHWARGLNEPAASAETSSPGS